MFRTIKGMRPRSTSRTEKLRKRIVLLSQQQLHQILVEPFLHDLNGAVPLIIELIQHILETPR